MSNGEFLNRVILPDGHYFAPSGTFYSTDVFMLRGEEVRLAPQNLDGLMVLPEWDCKYCGSTNKELSCIACGSPKGKSVR